MDVSMTFTFSGNIDDTLGDYAALYACNGCGAQVLDEDKTTHNKFHQALAELFELQVR